MEQNPYAAPMAEVAAPRATAAPLSLKQMLFSFEGRIRRGQYWAYVLGGSAISMLVLVAFTALVMGLTQGASADRRSTLATYVLLALYPPMIWMGAALQAKRWHDRNRSAWWMLLGAIPLANIWVMIEVGFLAGTPGSNDYGPPPP
jgi:uncharacterized membrane protein YhaH (DUF805 family)